jgi:hypothetical protein
MKFKEELLEQTPYYKSIRLHQSIKFDPNKEDLFCDKTAVLEELKLAKIACPQLSSFQVMP